MSETLPEHIAVDFGNHSVKALYLKDVDKGRPTVAAAASQVTPFGVINSYDDDKKQQLQTVLKDLYQSLGVDIKEVVVALPESSVFTRVVTLPKMEEDQVQDAVYWEAKQYIHIPLDEIRFGYTELSKQSTGERKVLVVGAPIKLVNLYTELLEGIDLVPVAMESESLAVLRTISFVYDAQEGITLDFGAKSTDMAIMKQGNLFFHKALLLARIC